MSPDNTSTPSDQAAGSAESPQQIRLELDANEAPTCYANMCAVTPMPLELVLDFVLMTAPPERQRGPVKIGSRVVMNYHSAKQLLVALQRAVQRQEAMYGPIELDPRKRLTPAARESIAQQASSSDNAAGGASPSSDEEKSTD